MNEKYLEIYKNYSSVMFPLDYFEFYEMLEGGYYDAALEVKDLIKCIVNEVSLPSKKLYEIRDELISRTEIIMKYLDKFALFEYIIARIEYKYRDDSDLEPIDIKFQVDNILRKVFSDKERDIVYSKLEACISQLPIRYTKQKFLSIFEECMRLYVGLNKNDVDNFMENIYSCTGLIEIKNSEYYCKLGEIESELENLDFSKLSLEGYSDFLDKYNQASEALTQTIDILQILTKLVNNMIILFETSECKEYAAYDVSIVTNGIIEKITKAVLSDNFEDITDDDCNAFDVLEGKVEKFIFDKDKFEAKYLEQTEDTKFLVLSKLASGSMFADIKDNSKNTCEVLVERNYINSLVSKFSECFSNKVQGEKKALTRARMAACLGQLPPLFDDFESAIKFFVDAFEQVSDQAEIRGSIDQILDIIE